MGSDHMKRAREIHWMDHPPSMVCGLCVQIAKALVEFERQGLRSAAAVARNEKATEVAQKIEEMVEGMS